MTEKCNPAILMAPWEVFEKAVQSSNCQELITDLQYYKHISIRKGKRILVKNSNGMLHTVDSSAKFSLLVSCFSALVSAELP